jgi:hypothetical protein
MGSARPMASSSSRHVAGRAHARPG